MSPLVASQIAAGEVVERPASVVKELVENSLDAGATRVTLELQDGGIELVRVSDEGRGIVREDLPLALAPHATSKIAQAADLDHIATLGFRGEALASIASVSRLSLRSRTASADEAWEIEVEGMVGEDVSRLPPARPAAAPVGTTVAVRNLFFNTPARRKFLRTPATEQGKCMDIFSELAMAHPATAFIAIVDGKRTLDLPPNQTPRDRAIAILGEELRDQLLDVHLDQFDDSRGVTLWGLAGLPAIARATRAAQHVFVNGRSVRDKTIQHALTEAYRGLIEPNRHATIVMMLEMSPQGVDVNVHPTKAEVRFRDSGLVHSAVLNSIRRALRERDLTPSATTIRPGLTGGVGPREISPTLVESPTVRTPEEARSAFVDYFKRFTSARAPEPLSYQAIRDAMNATGTVESPADEVQDPPLAPARTTTPAPAQGIALPTPEAKPRILQVHNSYLVTQDEQGVVIVDQHALHERVMFESLMARVLEGPLESQRLLAPIVVDAPPTRQAMLGDLSPLLAKLGIEAEPSGPRTIAVHAFPTFLFERGVDPAPFLNDLFERAESEGAEFLRKARGGAEDVLRDVLDMMACKAAVKAGDRLAELEQNELLRLRDAVERASNCPHGRPTTVRLTVRDLERLFGRA